MTIEQERLTPTQEELESWLTEIGTLPICPTWMYEAVRHCQRNMDLDVTEGFHEPERYAGNPIAKIINALPTLLAALKSPPIGGEGDLSGLLREQHEAMADVMVLRRQSSGPAQREMAEKAIAVWRKVEARLKASDLSHDRAPMTLADVETRAQELMQDPARSEGIKIGEWVAARMKVAAGKALTPTTSGDVGKLCERLRVSTEIMANTCSVPQEIWQEHSTAALEAATLLTQMEARETRMREALERVKRLERSIMIDVRTAHSGRGNGASSEMRSDDRDMIAEMRHAFAEIDALLTDPTPTEER